MLTVGDQGRAANPASNADAENRDRLITKKTEDRGSSNRPEVRDILRMKKSIYAFVASNERTEKDK
jgi:hypothetical protein